MDEKTHNLSSIRVDLESILGSFNKDTWRRMKRTAGIDPYQMRCSDEQWLKLCAYAAIRRVRPTSRITRISIGVFLKKHGNNPSEFIPGFVSTSRASELPEIAGGYELRRVIKTSYNLDIPESTIDRYCRVLFGQGLSVDAVYSRHQTEAIAKRRVELARSQKVRLIESGKRLAQFNKSQRTGLKAC